MATGKPATAQADALSLPEMLRIMDVATALRHDRELVEEQLNVDEIKVRLRAKLKDAARATGEDVTDAELDAAIDQYYNRTHVFREPPFSFTLALAHLYVRRRKIGTVAAVGFTALAFWWLLLGSGSAPLSSRGRTHRAVEALAGEMSRRSGQIRAVARDDRATGELAQLSLQADTFRKQDDLAQLQQVDSRLATLEKRLLEEYEVRVFFDPKKPRSLSMVGRKPKQAGDEVRGYYLIVQAVRPDGSLVSREVHDQETGQVVMATTWAEQVPKAVFDRLAHDKTEDGILNETAYAVKKRGRIDEEVVMPGADGKPLARIGQITHWLD